MTAFQLLDQIKEQIFGTYPPFSVRSFIGRSNAITARCLWKIVETQQDLMFEESFWCEDLRKSAKRTIRWKDQIQEALIVVTNWRRRTSKVSKKAFPFFFNLKKVHRLFVKVYLLSISTCEIWWFVLFRRP